MKINRILEGKNIIVAGANGQLGKSLVIDLEASGAIVYKLDREFSNTEEIDRRYIFECDITNKSEIVEVFSKILETSKVLHGLVNLAAINPSLEKLGNRTKLDQFDFKEDLESIKLTYAGTMNLVSSAENLFEQFSSIVITGSDLSLISPDQRLYCKCTNESNEHQLTCTLKPPSYSFEKFGLVGTTKYLSTYFGPSKVRVNCICPGPIDSDFPPEFRGKLLSRIPMKGLATNSDYNSSVIFLLSDMSRFITGITLPIDGGRSAW